jgi:glycosyltransferase involved in cell wall biosynthesis
MIFPRFGRMTWRDQCAVVIPCFNEEANIVGLVREVRRLIRTVFVVDDGSTDRTASLAAEAGAVVISHPQRNGKGASLMRGFLMARERGFSHVLCMDGDGQHSVTDIPAFFDCSEETNAGLIIGNRFEVKGSMPLVRRVVNLLMSRALSWVAGEKLPDTQCGFRLLRLSLLSLIETRSRHFEFESELLIEIIKAGGRVAFVPIETIYRSEQSKISPVKDTVRWFSWLLPSLIAAPFRRGRSLVPAEHRL